MRKLADELVRSSLSLCRSNWKQLFINGGFEDFAEAYSNNAVFHVNFRASNESVPSSVVLHGREQIASWWKNSVEAFGLAKLDGARSNTIMVVNDCRAVCDGSEFRFKGSSSRVHAETWVRDSAEDPWVLESHFIAIECNPALEQDLCTMLDTVKVAVKQACFGAQCISRSELIGLLGAMAPSLSKKDVDKIVKMYGSSDVGSDIDIDNFLDDLFGCPSTPASLATSLMEGVNRSKRARLENMKVFVLDNSLRESTVGQIRGHTPKDKLQILEWVNAVGFKYFIVGVLNKSRAVEDDFIEEMVRRGDDMSRAFAFTPVSDDVKDGHLLFGPDNIPRAMLRMVELGLSNPLYEIDIEDKRLNWDTFPYWDMFRFLFQWQKEKFGTDSKSFVNLRDFPVAMCTCPERLLNVVVALGKLPKSLRPMGLCIEEPMGTYLPDEVGRWTRAIRKVMDSAGWRSDGETTGLLLAHVHNQWGMADSVVLEMLASGADGIWCSLCEEGASQGHSCSAVMLANLARLRNRDVCRRYAMQHVAEAARAVTKITTGQEVAPRQVVYGPRAVEAVFDFSGIAGGTIDQNYDENDDGKVDEMDRFSLAKLLGVAEPPVRISTLASPHLIVRRLQQLFSDDPSFNEETAQKMKDQINIDLEEGKKEEYTSAIGLATLYDRVMNHLTPKMEEVIESDNIDDPFFVQLLEQAKGRFRKLSHTDDGLSIDFTGFYDGYLQPYFGCFTCDRTSAVLKAIDFDNDSFIEWKEWKVWLTWAWRQFPTEIRNLDDLIQCVFRNAFLPTILANHQPQ